MTTREFAPVMGASAARIFASTLGPRIALAPDNENGSQTPEQIAAAEAATAAAAAAATAAAEVAAAAEVTRLAEEEAARVAAEASMTEDQKEKARLLREVMDKKAKLKTVTDTAAAQALELKRFEGIDPDAVRLLLKERADAEAADLEAKGEFTRVKTMMTEAHTTEVKSLKDQIAAFDGVKSGLVKTIDDLTIGNNFNGSTYIREDLTLPATKARALYGAHFEIKDGEVVAYDKPAGAAERTPLVDSSGKILPFDIAMKKIIESDPEKDSLLRTKLKPGGGSKTQNLAVNTNAETSGLTGLGRIAAGLAARKV